MEEMIMKYMNNNYSITVKHSHIVVVDNFSDKFSDKLINSSSFTEEIEHIFGVEAYTLCMQWKKITYSKAKEAICHHLKQVRFYLGRTNWELYYPNGQEFSFDVVKEKLDNKYSEELIEYIYNDWYHDALIEQSRKIWNNFD